jgi:pyruvate/2-oxoglutarate dehydrogenase complex dihydrolipoamide acyltransferase (E2) component
MHTIEIPSLGESVQEGKILCWMKCVGDPVQKGDPLVEIETDKVNVEIESSASGVLRAILVPESASVPVGTFIALVGEADEPFPDPVLLSKQPIVVRHHDADKTNKARRPLLATLSWQGGLAVLLLILFTSQYRENWIIAVIVGILLVSFGFCLGRTVQRWRKT